MTTYTKPLLDAKDLYDLTGAKQVGAQIKWLRENRVGFTLDRHGRPKTTWGLVEKALLGERSQDAYKPPAKTRQAA